MAASWRRRCDARAKHKTARKAGDWRGAFRHCRNWAIPGKRRCRLHGGLSTGPKTPEGKAAVVAAMQEGRSRRIAQLAVEGKKINTGHNGGRYPKDWPPEMRHRTPTLTTLQQQIDAIAAPAASAQNEIDTRRQLLALILRGADAALTRPRSERGRARRSSTIALAKEALPILRRKLFGPK